MSIYIGYWITESMLKTDAVDDVGDAALMMFFSTAGALVVITV